MSVEVRNITKRFGSFTALENINLTAPDGDLVALIGPSGSGKTTLLRIIAGLESFEPVDGADILFKGTSVVGNRIGERKVGFVFQHYALFRRHTVYGNIAFGLNVRRGKDRLSRKIIRERVMNLIHLVQLDGLESRYPDQLSGGQRQRVALARALAIEPRFLLLDEPFGALDARVRQNLRRWLRRMHDEIKLTSIFVTHDQEEALELADSVIVMNRGRVEQEGTPAEVFHNPKNEFVMDFLGNVNLFHGRVESGRVLFDQSADIITKSSNKTRLFVRPHEIELLPENIDNAGLPAKISRIQLAGAIAKIELTDTNNKEIFVEMSHEKYSVYKFQNGDSVFAFPKNSIVFPEDYSI
ncbi:MAG: TOBE-like domain-containing protein [Planctomycetaceae bacterium]|jgi:sulfate transport system ATP-binding protein|nr:TOBE-like domain-containing protein [Planctomycetaceae bacterium]